ncbi:hypothetical protein [Desulfofundulus sp.]|uniref:hypothetical protein n=1 Tax=Desulfofundulus sp. TaxID=2282750 RepID=UPI003C725B76
MTILTQTCAECNRTIHNGELLTYTPPRAEWAAEKVCPYCYDILTRRDAEERCDRCGDCVGMENLVTVPGGLALCPECRDEWEAEAKDRALVHLYGLAQALPNTLAGWEATLRKGLDDVDKYTKELGPYGGIGSLEGVIKHLLTCLKVFGGRVKEVLDEVERSGAIPE